MRQAWHIKGPNNDNEEDNDVDRNSVGLETSLGTVKDKQSLVGKQRCYECGKTGHRSAKYPNKKKKGQTEKACTVTDTSVREPNPCAVTAAKQVTRKRTAGTNTHTKPHLCTPRKLQECSWMRSCLCATLHKARCSTSCKA
jgi:hypothetical protein